MLFFLLKIKNYNYNINMKKGLLIILDGYGEGEKYEYNAVANAKTTFINSLKSQSNTRIKTDSEAVGLLPNNMGGSEVGHMTIGAGRVVLSTASEITKDIESGEFKNNKNLIKVLTKLKSKQSDLHIVGLMSDKNIHSNIYHAIETIKIATNFAKHIYVHFITDGRDTNSFESLNYLNLLKKSIKNIKNCEIASISGRFYAMDRESNMDRTQRAFDAMFYPKDFIKPTQIEDYIKSQHNNNITDEYIEPISVKSSFESIKKDDTIFFFNFREDRVRQLAGLASELKCNIVTMANVGNVNSIVLFKERNVPHTLSEYISKLGLRQVKISETTKYAHVTYFLNGRREEPFKNEDRILVPTIKVDKFDKTPKMRARAITKNVLKAIKSQYDLIVVNYSNPDMIGHTGNYVATVKALEFLDKQVKKVVSKAVKYNYSILLTADHGNAEYMQNTDGSPNTSHTLNKVFCVAIKDGKVARTKENGELKDIAQTLLDIMEVNKNKYFEGKSLIQS